MSEDKKFANRVELESWLKEERGLDCDHAGEASEKLFSNGYNKPSRLMGITVEELKEFAGMVGPLARELSNKLVPKQIDQSAAIIRVLNRIDETKLDDMATNDIPVSEATVNFTSSTTIVDKEIKIHVQEVNKETGGKEPEAAGRPGFQRILPEEIVPPAVDDGKEPATSAAVTPEERARDRRRVAGSPPEGGHAFARRRLAFAQGARRRAEEAARVLASARFLPQRWNIDVYNGTGRDIELSVTQLDNAIRSDDQWLSSVEATDVLTMQSGRVVAPIAITEAEAGEEFGLDGCSLFRGVGRRRRRLEMCYV